MFFLDNGLVFVVMLAYRFFKFLVVLSLAVTFADIAAVLIASK